MSSSNKPPSVVGHRRFSSGNFFRRIPTGYTVTLASDTNSTMTGIPGPGRALGSILDSAGRQIEKVIDRFAEERLGLGPNMAALRLISALHDAHVLRSRETGVECHSDYTDTVSQADDIVEQLILVCNGLCSQCHGPYIPYLLQGTQTPIFKSLAKLTSYINQPSRPSNVALAAMYVRVIAESKVLSRELFKDLNLSDNLSVSIDTAQRRLRDSSLPADELIGLQKALESVELQMHTSTSDDDPLLRFNTTLGMSETEEEHKPLLFSLADIARGTNYWATQYITFTFLLSLCYRMCIQPHGSIACPPALELLLLIEELQRHLNLPRHLSQHSSMVYELIAAEITSDPANLNAISVIDVSEIDTGATITDSIDYSSELNTAVLSPDGKTVALGCLGGKIVVRDSTGGDFCTLYGHKMSVKSLFFSADGATLVSCSVDGSIRVWDVRSGKLLHAFEEYRGHKNSIRSIAISHDGTHLISGSEDNTIMIWHMVTKAKPRVLFGHGHWVNSVTFSSDGRYIGSGSQDRTIRIWSVRTGSELALLKGHHIKAVHSVTFSPDNKDIISGSADGSIRIWSVQTGSQIAILKGLNTSQPVNSITISPDGYLLVSGSDDGTIHFWKLQTRERVYQLNTRGLTSVKAVSFCADGTRLLTSWSPSSIRLWNIHRLRD